MRTLARLAGATYLAIFVTGLIFRNFIPDSGSLTAHWGADDANGGLPISPPMRMSPLS